MRYSIDAHQHFWKFDPVRDSWINNDMSVLKKDFFPGELQPLLKENSINACIAVQAAQAEEETDFLLQLAGENDFIKAVVGWIDLKAENINERLTHYKQFPALKGFRHILQSERDRAFMLQPDFMRGISALQTFGFTYDILIYPDQLLFSEKLVSKFPNQKFVIDHIAKPEIKNKNIDGWKSAMQEISKHENVYCKISGLVTEADWHNWKQEDFIAYIDAVVDAFGIHRVMYGSDWPVCLVAASYSETIDIVKDYFSTFSDEDQNSFFGHNAKFFYNITHIPNEPATE